MRTYMLFSALALTGCASPEAAFPDLAALPTPAPPQSTAAERAAALKSIEADGDKTREAGRMVQAGEELTRPLPR